MHVWMCACVSAYRKETSCLSSGCLVLERLSIWECSVLGWMSPQSSQPSAYTGIPKKLVLMMVKGFDSNRIGRLADRSEGKR